MKYLWSGCDPGLDYLCPETRSSPMGKQSFGAPKPGLNREFCQRQKVALGLIFGAPALCRKNNEEVTQSCFLRSSILIKFYFFKRSFS